MDVRMHVTEKCVLTVSFIVCMCVYLCMEFIYGLSHVQLLVCVCVCVCECVIMQNVQTLLFSRP